MEGAHPQAPTWPFYICRHPWLPAAWHGAPAPQAAQRALVEGLHPQLALSLALVDLAAVGSSWSSAQVHMHTGVHPCNTMTPPQSCTLRDTAHSG